MAAQAELSLDAAAPLPPSTTPELGIPKAANDNHGRQPVFSPKDQFNRYMADVKRTALMSPEKLTQVARESYKCRYGILKTLSQFPPCAEALVDQFREYDAMGFKLNGFVDSYGDQSVAAKDALAMLNKDLGKGKVEDSLSEEDSRRRGLEMLRAHWQAFKHADASVRQSATSPVRKRLSHTFLYFGLRHEEFTRLCNIFEETTFEIQRFADLFVSLATQSAHLHILDHFTDEDVQAITRVVPEQDRRRFFADATRLRQRLQDTGLSIRECIVLRSDYDHHKREMERLNNEIVEANLLLAARQAIRQRPHDDRLFDACQEANMGLLKAVNLFSYWKGYKFATYACQWINQRLQLNKQATVNSDFPVPVSIVNRGVKIHKAREQHGEHLGNRPLTAAQVAQEIGCTPSQVDEVAVAFSAVTNAEEVAVAVPCESTSASSLAEESEVQVIVREALSTLPEKKREICRLRWGIGTKEPLSLAEIGKVFQLSTERVRDIECEGLRFLSRCSYASRMRELLEGC